MEKIGECAFRLKDEPSSLTGHPIEGASDAAKLVCLNGLIPTLINWAFVVLGLVAVFFLASGAIKYITSNGDAKAMKSARDTITFAIIGTVLVIASFAIAHAFANIFLPDPSALFNFHIGP